MSPLVPCPSCTRHVRSNETQCPFCRTDLPAELAARVVPAARVRLDRLAAFTFAASLAATAAACGGKSVEPIPSSSSEEIAGERGGDAKKSGSESKKVNPEPDREESGPAPMYGMPPPGDDDDDWGGTSGMYGMPPPPPRTEDGGTSAAMYGMPPGDR